MFITLTILCNKPESKEEGLTTDQLREMGINIPKDSEEEGEWRVSKVNINHISAYYLHGNTIHTLVHCGGHVFTVKETPEEIDKLIKHITEPTNGNTIVYTATVS